MPNDKYKNYLIDLGTITKEYAREAINDHTSPKDTESKDFRSGYMMGFHRMITLLQQQAELFDIPLQEINLEDIKESDFFK